MIRPVSPERAAPARRPSPATEPGRRSEVEGRSRQRFCEYLRDQRRAADRSLEDIARITKIPERSLRCLEDGAFEALPADVFVRGFLRSYAGCLGLDVDDVLRRYAACGLAPAPVASDLAVLPVDDSARPDAGEGVGEVKRVVVPAATPSADRARPPGERRMARGTGAPPGGRRRRHRNGRPVAPRAVAQQTFLPPRTLVDDAPRRGPLTLAVIILVIVATLAMSYLLRRPSDGGDGITRRPAVAPSERG